jgi:hypothetical protein
MWFIDASSDAFFQFDKRFSEVLLIGLFLTWKVVGISLSSIHCFRNQLLVGKNFVAVVKCQFIF